MNRREFLQGSSAASLAFSIGGKHASASAAAETKRVGLIGTGWYGKGDLLRLIQVAPVEVVSLCDVDKRDARRGRRSGRPRQASKKTPRTYADYREMLKEKDLDIVLIATPDHWHALPMIAAVRSRRRRLRAEADQRRRRRGPGDAGRRAQAPARRAGRHPAPQHAAPHRGPRPDHPRRQARQDRPGRDLLLLPHAEQRQPARHQAARLPRLRDVDRPGADAALQLARPSPRLARVHGVRQRHHRRHVHPHARHGPLDARPGLAEAGQLDGRHPRRTRRARPTSPTRRRPRSTSATWTSSGSIAPGAQPPTPSIPGARRSTATRGRSRPASTATTSCPSGGGQPIHSRRRPTSSNNTPRTRPRRTSRSTSPRRSAAT